VTDEELLRKLNQILGRYEKTVGIKAVGSEGLVLKTDPEGRLILVYETHAHRHAVGGDDPFDGTKHQISLMLERFSADPTLAEARLWFRSDLRLPSYSPDGLAVRRIPYGTINVDAHASRHLVGELDALSVGPPVDLGESLGEGSATNFCRRDHVHKLLVRAAKAGATVGTRKRLNFVDTATVAFSVTDDPTNDEIDVSATSIVAAVAKTTLAIDETEVYVTGTSESLFTPLDKTFDFIKSTAHLDLESLMVLLQMKVTGGTGTIKIYMDAEVSPRLTFTTTSTAYEVKEGSVDVSGLPAGLHTLTIRGYTNLSGQSVYLRLYHVLGCE